MGMEGLQNGAIPIIRCVLAILIVVCIAAIYLLSK